MLRLLPDYILIDRALQWSPQASIADARREWGLGPFVGDWSVQLIVGDKRINVTMRAKDAMIVIIALKGERLLKGGLPTLLYRV